MRNNSTTPLLSLGTLLILAASALAQNGPVSSVNPKGKNPQPPPAAKSVTIENVEGDVAEALSIIESSHIAGSKLDYNNVFKASIDGMLHTLDPHSNYFDPREFEQFTTDQSSKYFGIGATIGDLSDKDGKVVATYIRATFENAPANRAGLRYGDKIISVNGQSMLGRPYSEVRDFLRGQRGTPAKLVVERHGSGKREAVDIIRDAVSQPSISEAYMVRPGVGYIAMTGGFNKTTYAEFVDAMRALKAKGMKQLVLDLKNNGGGLVGQAFKVASTFLAPGQTIFTQKGRFGGTIEPYRSDNPNPETMPLVLLVNRNSASASEILAGALQDHDRALIAGETTFGKGLVQNPFVLDYGSMLLLTIAKYETPAGRLIQRDYSDGNLYNYYTKGGRMHDAAQTLPRGPESRTDAGRPVYSGGGITPDVELKSEPALPSDRIRSQIKIANSVFAFALDLAYGKVPGHDALRADKPIAFSYDIKATDYVVSDAVFEQFKRFASEKYGIGPAQTDKERKFVERALRTELVTAAYGSTTALQVSNEYDEQLLEAIDLLPQAKELAMQGAKAKGNAANRGAESNR